MVIDATPLDLGRGTSPHVAATNDSFFATGGRFNIVPERGAPQPIMLPAIDWGAESWDLAWDGSQLLYVWSARVGEQTELRGIRLDHDGALVGDPILIATLDSPMGVNIVHDGGQWVVTLSFVNADTGLAARITSDGTLRDPDGVSISVGLGATAFADGVDGRFVIIREVTESATPARGTELVAKWVSITGDKPASSSDSDDSVGCGRTDRGGSGSSALVIFVGFALRRRRRRGCG